MFRSIGYRGVPLEGVPFDEQHGIVPNEAGRIGEGGEYVVGWIKRGPSGIIGTNKRDAQETVDTLLEDVEAGRLLEPSDPDPESLEQLLTERKPDHVTYDGWEAIDRAEREAGEAQGRPRDQVHPHRGAAGGGQGEGRLGAANQRCRFSGENTRWSGRTRRDIESRRSWRRARDRR